MPRKGKSYYISSEGPADASLTTGLQWLVQSAREHDTAGLVVVSTLQNLRNLAWNKNAAIFEALEKSQNCTVEGASLRLMTLRRKDIYLWNGPILAIYGGQKLLDAVDALDGTADVLCIPWSRAEAQAWIDTWGAVELGQPTASGSPPSQLPEVVNDALSQLTSSVNLATGIVHSSDKQQAIETLETLFHNHVTVDPERIRQELLLLGWKPDGAQGVKKLAEMIWAGRHPRGSTGRASDDLWQYWRKSRSG
jgi:hypothetical protein